MANGSDSSPLSLPSAIERSIPREIPLPPNEEERLDMVRVTEDARRHRRGLDDRTRGGTEPVSAYKNVWLTDKQINYLLVILKPYVSPIAEECRVKLESA